jgi:predicted alpha/beta-fold hydrolase
MSNAPYNPPLLLRNGHIQTFLASSSLRAWGANEMQASARAEIIATDAGVNLLGYRSRQIGARPKGLAVLLHGWEGSSDSTYMRRTGRSLYRHGYEIFRLNLRDHGPSHHLNPGFFYAAWLDEVFEAVRRVSQEPLQLPVFLVGFSLGANFALRIALRCRRRAIPNLRHVVAISPVLAPEESTRRADRHPVIRRYFIKKWRRSLMLKQQLFPQLYDFGPVMRCRTIREATDLILERYSNFPSSKAYFDAYTLTGTRLRDLSVPATLLTSADDPIIPVQDFQELQLSPSTTLVIHRHGGHNGFIEGPSLRSRYENDLPELFDRLTHDAPSSKPSIQTAGCVSSDPCID